MVQTKGQIIENSNLLFRLHHQRFYPKEVVKHRSLFRFVAFSHTAESHL